YNMPPYSYINPAILISSFSSWQEVYNWWFFLYADKLKINDEMDKVLKELIKDKETSHQKAKAIYEYVAKDIRYVAVEYGDSGYEPHSASEVFVNKYGDCKDQAVLLTALMQEAGLDAYPVLISTRSSYPIDKSFPSINFNHAIAAVRIDGKFIFIDPTSNTTPFGQIPLSDQDRTILLFLEEGYKILKTSSSKDSGIDYLMEIDIAKSENARIKRRVSPKGYFASSYRGYLKYSHPSRIKEDISQKMVEISSFSRLIDLNIENEKDLDKNPMLEYAFAADNFLSPSGSLRVLKPLNQFDFKASLISKKTRDFPIDFGGIFSKKAEIKVNLPSNIEVKYLPDSRHFENKWLSLETAYKTAEKTINFSQKFLIKKRFVTEDEYQDFKEKFKEILYYLKGQVILETKEK
ncbi:MAG: transglutaminase-like domain-containing protein, partial [Candidatus Omnitrophica bacterium]|nr:transglutaminase-like domain-containing protein [Candidatus Omnitrophota bacterium]